MLGFVTHRDLSLLPIERTLSAMTFYLSCWRSRSALSIRLNSRGTLLLARLASTGRMLSCKSCALSRLLMNAVLASKV